MKTVMSMVDGSVHVVNGHPQDFMYLSGDSLGVSKTDAVITAITGEEFNLSDVVTMQMVE